MRSISIVLLNNILCMTLISLFQIIEQGSVRRRNEYNIDVLRYLDKRGIIQVQYKMNISIVFRWIMAGRGVRHTRHSSTKVSNGIATVQTCFTIILFLTACQLGKLFSIRKCMGSVIYLRFSF